jgi:hypothetical protein
LNGDLESKILMEVSVQNHPAPLPNVLLTNGCEEFGDLGKNEGSEFGQDDVESSR